MKLSQMLWTALLAATVCSCKKTNPLTTDQSAVMEQKELRVGNFSDTYIQDFYGVNVVRQFIVTNPDNQTTSYSIRIYWDENGVAKYTVNEIPRDKVREASHRIYMPESEFDRERASVRPTNTSVKTVFLGIRDGEVVVTPMDHINGGGSWCWVCCGNSPATYIPALNSWACFGLPGQPSPCPATMVRCGDSAPFEPFDWLTFQTN
jgi:uncharacterized protein YcfL